MCGVLCRVVNAAWARVRRTLVPRWADFLRFDDCWWQVALVVEQVVGTTLFASAHLAARHDEPAIGEAVLFHR